jgi:hypothetical protein
MSNTKQNIVITPEEVRSETQLKYYRTKKGLISVIYGSQRASSKKRGHAYPTYSKEELRDWLYSQPKFHELYNDWKDSGYHKDLKPSVDRIKSELPYTFNNIQLMTWAENNSKGKSEKYKVSISQYTLDGVFVDTFGSVTEASHIVGISRSGIQNNLLGISKSSKGFIWKYN